MKETPECLKETSENLTETLRHSAQIVETMPQLTRWLFRVFGRRINREITRILLRHYERGTINSKQLHTLTREFDPTQPGVFGQIKHVSRARRSTRRNGGIDNASMLPCRG